MGIRYYPGTGGALAERYLTMMPLKLIAGLGFLAIGAWTLQDHFSAA